MGHGSIPRWSAAEVQRWWAANDDPAQWADASAQWIDALAQAYPNPGPREFSPNSDFSRWLLHARWLALWDGRHEQAGLAASFASVGSKPEAMALFLNQLHERDDKSQAVEILCRIEKEHPELLNRFPALAVAVALVFDQPFPRRWPHHQIPFAQLPIGDPDPVQRFAYHATLSTENKLEYKLEQLSVVDCMFIVDTLLSFDELNQARDTRFRLARLDQAYSSVPYDYPRVEKDQYNWPHDGPYLLANLPQQKGICVDQAYYGWMIAKAKGVPSLFFRGQGSGGGHAWFGYLQRPGRWNTDVGRYESQNYPVGNAMNPQTWEEINDAELEFLTRSGQRAGDSRVAAQTMLAWAALRHDADPQAHRFITMARTSQPDMIEAWRVEAEVMDATATVQDRQRFLDQWISAFAKVDDYRTEGQQRLLAIYQETNDSRADALNREIIRQNRRKRFDIGIGSGAGEVLDLLEKENWSGAERAFRNLVARFDRQGGGNLYYILIRPYVEACLEENQPELATKALDYVERRMAIRSGSILDGEFKKLRDTIHNHEVN